MELLIEEWFETLTNYFTAMSGIHRYSSGNEPEITRPALVSGPIAFVRGAPRWFVQRAGS